MICGRRRATDGARRLLESYLAPDAHMNNKVELAQNAYGSEQGGVRPEDHHVRVQPARND